MTLSSNLYKEIADIPLLTEEEERNLVGDVESLALHNLRLVLSIASKYKNYGVEFDDLFQAGVIGLLIACERYDGTSKFGTYSYNWILKYVLKALNENYSVKIPLNTAELATTVKMARSRLSASLEREATNEEIALELNIPVEKVEDVLFATQTASSLDAPVGSEDDTTFGEIVSNERKGFTDPYHAIVYEDDCATLRRVLATLPPREAELLTLRFGLDGQQGLTLEETGKKLGVGKERTRQIENNAIRKLRSPARANMLKNCLC